MAAARPALAACKREAPKVAAARPALGACKREAPKVAAARPALGACKRRGVSPKAAEARQVVRLSVVAKPIRVALPP
jgi:hypothetical protein